MSDLTPRIPLDMEKIETFCKKWQIVEFSLFGSVLTDDFRPDSDVDVMVEFVRPGIWKLHDLDLMEEELTQILGRTADLSTKLGIVHMPNYIRRKSILNGSRVFYAA